MIHEQNAKTVNVAGPVAIVDNASFTTIEIDTVGYDYCSIYWRTGATDIAMTALKVQESDTSGSGFTDITALVGGTATTTDGATSTLPTATDDDEFRTFDIDLRGRKRFLDLVATAGDGTVGTFGYAFARLSRAEEHPNTGAERGGTGNEILRA